MIIIIIIDDYIFCGLGNIVQENMDHIFFFLSSSDQVTMYMCTHVYLFMHTYMSMYILLKFKL